MKHGDIIEKIIKAYYTVYNEMSFGFLEKVYENAMIIELKKLGLTAVRQQPIHVYYDDEIVGEYFADLIVEDRVIIELKAKGKLNEEHEAQLINYLKATEIEVGLLMNFGTKPDFKRKIFSNEK